MKNKHEMVKSHLLNQFVNNVSTLYSSNDLRDSLSGIFFCVYELITLETVKIYIPPPLKNKKSKTSTNRQEQPMTLQNAYQTLGQIIFELGLAEIFDLTPEDLTHPENTKLQKFIGFCFQAGQETTFSPLNQKKFKLEGERHLGRFI